MDDDRPYILSREELLEYRFEKPVKVIVQACNKLKCSNIVRTKSLLIYHFLQASIVGVEYDSYVVGAASVSLSIKFYEESVEFDAIIICIFSILGIFPSVHDEEFKKAKKSVRDMEIIILRVLEFSLDCEIAHQYLIYFLDDVKDFLTPLKARDAFISVCMAFVDDFYLSRKCIQYSATEIATVIILAGFYYMGVSFTNTNGYLEEWVKGLADVRPEKRCNLIQDIFEASCISPIAELELEKLPELARM